VIRIFDTTPQFGEIRNTVSSFRYSVVNCFPAGPHEINCGAVPFLAPQYILPVSLSVCLSVCLLAVCSHQYVSLIAS
jgi:hypothetical protein